LQFGNLDGFPEIGDPQDCTFLPLAGTAAPRPRFKTGELPSISVVTPSLNQAAYLGQTLDSILSEHYPRLETVVMDGGSTDGSVDVLRRYGDRLTCWQSEPDRGPAHAINKGLARASGEVLAWLNSDDLFAPGAIWAAARLFAADPDLEMVYGNALYIDPQNNLCLADHGCQRTGLYYGQVEPLRLIPRYWKFVQAVPQPTVFFRRRLLERCGPLDERYQFIFDFELLHRFVREGKVRKLERTQAYYRLHPGSKTADWNQFVVELYRFSRPLWPRWFSPQFMGVLRNYVTSYLDRRYPGHPHTLRWWGVAGLVGLSAALGIGNPEAFGSFLQPVKNQESGVRNLEPGIMNQGSICALTPDS
jgi:glycosyltransferase involved in cell wall biosynthesis